VAPLELIAWPYHAGLRDVGMGRGPTALTADTDLLAALGDPPLQTVAPVDESQPEVARIFELDRRLADAVRAVVQRDAFPLVLAGNCISALGTTAGAGTGGLGAVWLDAHADFDTTDDNLSGFTDVLGLSILTGTGMRALRKTIGGFEAVKEEHVVLGAVRDLEPYQRERLDASSVRTVPGRMDATAFADALDDLRRRVDRVYLHVDLDAIDAGEARANEYAADGGPSAAAVLDAVDAVFDRFAVAAAAITAYDPEVDPRAARVARRVAERIAARATGT
jgi:arginase